LCDCLTSGAAAGPIVLMDQGKKPRPSATDLRREREAAALRANLRKRKEQQHARETPPPKARTEQLPNKGG
jgi:hypothetical protein